jgi:hypothetical protein
VFFYDLAIELRRVRAVVLLFFELRSAAYLDVVSLLSNPSSRRLITSRCRSLN